MKEIRIEARVRNNVLWHAIFDTWGNVHQFCLAYKLNEWEVGKLLNLTRSPLTKKGKWRPFCMKLASILGCKVELLFPAQLYLIEMPASSFEVSFAELPPSTLQIVRQLPAGENPEEILIAIAKRQELKEILQDLDPREKKVLFMYFGLGDDGKEYTFEQIAEEMDVGPERVRQINQKCLRKLRHVKRSKKILEALA